jgi:hypothetical protein
VTSAPADKPLRRPADPGRPARPGRSVPLPVDEVPSVPLPEEEAQAVPLPADEARSVPLAAEEARPVPLPGEEAQAVPPAVEKVLAAVVRRTCRPARCGAPPEWSAVVAVAGEPVRAASRTVVPALGPGA